MKVNAPEKIYVHEASAHELTEKLPYHIEYTRTDAFIEKACDAYCRLCDTKECGETGECCWVEKFRKQLKK